MHMHNQIPFTELPAAAQKAWQDIQWDNLYDTSTAVPVFHRYNGAIYAEWVPDLPNDDYEEVLVWAQSDGEGEWCDLMGGATALAGACVHRRGLPLLTDVCGFEDQVPAGLDLDNVLVAWVGNFSGQLWLLCFDRDTLNHSVYHAGELVRYAPYPGEEDACPAYSAIVE